MALTWTNRLHPWIINISCFWWLSIQILWGICPHQSVIGKSTWNLEPSYVIVYLLDITMPSTSISGLHAGQRSWDIHAFSCAMKRSATKPFRFWQGLVIDANWLKGKPSTWMHMTQLDADRLTFWIHQSAVMMISCYHPEQLDMWICIHMLTFHIYMIFMYTHKYICTHPNVHIDVYAVQCRHRSSIHVHACISFYLSMYLCIHVCMIAKSMGQSDQAPSIWIALLSHFGFSFRSIPKITICFLLYLYMLCTCMRI